MKKFFIELIHIYQHLCRPWRIIPRCKYLPSCSDYTIMAIEKYGVLLGAAKGLWRIARCNPLTKGGIDLP